MSYYHLTHSQTKHDMLNTHISERKFWVPAWCVTAVSVMWKNLGTPHVLT